MRIPRRPAATILTLCLLVMQVQVWASVVLGCRHEAGLAGSAAAIVCPLHQGGALKPDQEHPTLLDCQKCVLHCVVSVPALTASAPLLPGTSGPQTPVAAKGLHFYCFTPDSPHRPPIS